MGGMSVKTGGTSWATAVSNKSTTPGWEAVITDCLTNPSQTGLKLLHLTVWVGVAGRYNANNKVTVTYSGAPAFTKTPNCFVTGFCPDLASNQNAYCSGSIYSWTNGSFGCIHTWWGQTGAYPSLLIFEFDGFTTASL